MLVYLSSGECYTYIMCHVWLCVSVFLQACGVLWFLNILCVACFGVLCTCIVEQYIIKQVSSSWSTFIQTTMSIKMF